MCLNCGCGEINERHGNQDNIVADDIRRAAGATGQDMRTTITNMRDSLDQVGGMASEGSSRDARDAGMASSGMGRTAGGREVPRT